MTGATVQAVALPSSFRQRTYTILNATGGLGGTQFAGLTVTGSFSPARNPHLTYDSNDVYLVLDPSAGLGVTPCAALQVQSFRTPSYGERAVAGSNAFALAYDARSTAATCCCCRAARPGPTITPAIRRWALCSRRCPARTSA